MPTGCGPGVVVKSVVREAPRVCVSGRKFVTHKPQSEHSLRVLVGHFVAPSGGTTACWLVGWFFKIHKQGRKQVSKR